VNVSTCPLTGVRDLRFQAALLVARDDFDGGEAVDGMEFDVAAPRPSVRLFSRNALVNCNRLLQV
jgi:hypothetical protein